MFDVSFPELIVVALLGLLIFGPQELGRILYGLGRVVRRLQYLRFALSQQFEDFMQKAGDSDPAAQVNFETSPVRGSLEKLQGQIAVAATSAAPSPDAGLSGAAPADGSYAPPAGKGGKAGDPER